MSERVFEWCNSCEYLQHCYTKHGGPYCLCPACGVDPKILEVTMREDGKHYRFVKNGRNLFTNKKGGYYVDIYEVAVVVETWYDNEMFDWTVYRGYCPSDWTNAEMQHVVGGFGDKQPAEYAYQFWTEDGLPKEKFRW